MKTNHNSLVALAAISTLACAAVDAHASCAADSTREKVQQAFANGQAKEKVGRNAEAVRWYLAAQAYICEANPVEADAAKRAAVLSRPLAQSAEKSGDLEAAYRLYESGGHYGAADRLVLAMLRAKADEPHAFDRARAHLHDRTEPSFAQNFKIRIAAAGGYQLDRRIHDEVMGWPAKACERALQRESQTFSEDYVRDYAALIQSRPDDATDFAAMNALGARQAAFANQWPQDRVQESQELIEVALDWSRRITDAALQGKLAAQIRAVAVKRAQLLVQKYFTAPRLLTAAIDYYQDQKLPPEVGGVKARAGQLGAEAERRGRLLLAGDYYDVAGDGDKSRALQARAREQALKKMQPDVEAMQRAAAQMQKQYSDPAKVAEMRRQAEEARKAMQKSQAQNGAKSAEDLEKELGL